MVRRSSSRPPPPELNSKSIHEVVSSTFSPEMISKAIEAHASNHENTAFEDTLQAIEVLPRATKFKEAKTLIGQALLASIVAAGDDAQKWKLLILTILRKRYHMKSPEAKSVAREQKTNKEKGCSSEQVDTSGHGERMTFYILFSCLHYLSTREKESSIDSHIIDLSTKACQCLGRLAVAAGGTRDICTLMEHLVYEHLVQHGIINICKDKGNKRAISSAMIKLAQTMPISTVLSDLVKAAVELLDSDFSLIVQSDTVEKKDESEEKEIKLQSTINTFIPHHDRGSKERRLAQSVAEFMIWKETKHSQKDPKFVQAITDICSSSLSLSTFEDSSMDDKIISSLHVVQTSIRRFRKKLNESSRKRGFSLCTAYSMEPSSITLSMVKRGREGDVTLLQKVATKKKDNRIMKIIANRNADPSKAIAMASVRELCNNWVPLESDNDELAALQLKIQEAKVRATIKLLEDKIPSECSKKDVVLASLDTKEINDCNAVLVAAALEPKCKWDNEDKEMVDSEERSVTLFISNEKCDVSTPALVMSLLNQICTRNKNDSNQTPTTTKDVQNLIERHLGQNSHLLLIASADIKIEQRVLAKLQQENSTIHCHMNDEFSSRMEREKAKVGDVTITLAWDNECDLDLSCICPNGDRIYYGNKDGGGEVGGGYLDVDMNVNGESKEPVENIFFGDAEKGIQAAIGKYKVVVQNYAYHGKELKEPDKIPWRLRVSKNDEIHTYSGECVGTGSSSDVVAVEFEYEGRKVPPPEEIESALQSSKLVSVTSSTGETIDSISNLLSIFDEHTQITDVQNLVETDVQNLVETDIDETMEENKDETDAPTRPLMAENKSFDITNRDRLYLKLSRLPKSFHSRVNQSFEGTMSLIEFTASELAKRLIADKIQVQELKAAGYQEEIIGIVTEKMKKFGL